MEARPLHRQLARHGPAIIQTVEQRVQARIREPGHVQRQQQQQVSHELVHMSRIL